jgi:MFS family permease
MRALTGIGGGGLMTMATIINSDLIPFHNRGMYQAAQNVLHGFGSICGASFGGAIADTIGWRWCFLLQVPVALFALVVGKFVINLPRREVSRSGIQSLWQQVDILGSLLLILGLSIQLVGLSLGGNELPWSNPWIIASLVGSFALLALFIVTEAKTTAIPVIPLRMLRGVQPICIQIANVCVGAAAYAVSIQFVYRFSIF